MNILRGHIFSKLTVYLAVIYMAIISVYLVWHRSWFAPDQFILVALVPMLLLGRSKQFLRDWSTPLILLFGYDIFRSLLPFFGQTVHIFPMIDFDKALFGFIPTIKLQSLLLSPVSLHWYDYLAVILYIIHFIVPMMVGMLFWLKDLVYFKEYTWGLLVLSYAAFITYVIFPAMPPWMAGKEGFIPPVQEISDRVMLSFAHPIDVPSVYRLLGANLVAAVPSLHAAYPWITLLFIVKRFRPLSLVFTPYVLGVWFAVVYLGEHYVFDVVMGIIYGTVAFYIVMNKNSILIYLSKVFNKNPVSALDSLPKSGI